MTAAGLPVWQDEPYCARAPLAGDRTAEVAVIGAGVGGISAAWHLAAYGFRPLVLEAATVASGATGRSGGFLEAGAADGHTMARRILGRERACRFHRATAAARDELLELAAEHAPGAWARRAGSLRVACDTEDLADALEEFRALAEDGLGGSWLSRDELPEPVRNFGLGGLLEPREALVHPARLFRGLASALSSRADICEHTPVAGPVGRRDGSGYLLETPGGTVRAEHVIIACDGGLGTLVPAASGQVTCRRLHIVATAPVPGLRLPHGVHWRFGYEYGQQLPDGRFVLGGYSDTDPGAGDSAYELGGRTDPAVHDNIERAVRERLGISEPVTHRWAGLVGYSADGQPIAAQVPGLPGVFALGGYCGSGNLTGWLAGRVAADLIAKGASPDGDLFSGLAGPAEAGPPGPAGPAA